MLFKKLIPALLWALFILGLCALPGTAIPELSFLDWLKPDKIVHLVLFGVQSYLLIKAFLAQTANPFLKTRARLVSVTLSCIYGVVVELIQEYFIPTRRGDVFDSLADGLGAFMGLWFFNYWNKRRLARA